jgi:hypothetical protein
MYFDGSLKLGGAEARVLFISPSRKQLKYVLQIPTMRMSTKPYFTGCVLGRLTWH